MQLQDLSPAFFTLKSIKGHANIETIEMYVELFACDLQVQHEKFSPIEHLAETLNLVQEARCMAASSLKKTSAT
ncbi:hypothetical protein [Paenibacillus roseus]